MWLRVATNPDSIIKSGGYTSIVGTSVEEYHFDDTIAELLEKKDDFLMVMWNRFDALFDWGDYDYFTAERCIPVLDWVNEKLETNLSTELREFYTLLRIFLEKGIRYGTGLAFDF